MKPTFLLLALWAAFSCAFTEQAYAGKRPLALIWNGPGICDESCPEAVLVMAERAGFRTKLVNQDNFSQKLLDAATLWIQPGGNAIELSHAFGPARMQMLRTFISGGGGYLGFCAGAFFADTWVDDFNTVPGLAITPVITEDYAKVELGKNDAIVAVNWASQVRHLYFSEGATLRAGPIPKTVRVIARYHQAGLPAGVAAWENRYGAGKVVVAGVHPEAPQDWKTDLNDPDGDDFDLALEMFQRVMTR